MTGSFYQNKIGWLHSLDPRASILASFFLVVGFFFIDSILVVLALLISLHFILLTAAIPLKALFSQWKPFLPLMLIIVILRPLLQGQGSVVLLEWKFIRITQEGILSGLLLAIRLPLLVLTCNIPLMTHRQNALIRGWVALGIPYKIGLILILSLRFIPYFRESLIKIEQAQQMRGLSLKNNSLRKRIPILVTLVVWALRTSETLSYALETRGLGLANKPTFLVELHFRFRDFITVLLSFLLAGACTCFGLFYT